MDERHPRQKRVHHESDRSGDEQHVPDREQQDRSEVELEGRHRGLQGRHVDQWRQHHREHELRVDLGYRKPRHNDSAKPTTTKRIGASRPNRRATALTATTTATSSTTTSSGSMSLSLGCRTPGPIMC